MEVLMRRVVEGLLDRLVAPPVARAEKPLTKQIAKVDRKVTRLANKLRKQRKATKKANEAAKREAEKAARRKAKKHPAWTYEGDGMATTHLSPFLDDPEFSDLYEEMAAEWFPNVARMEARWRTWLLTRFARHCQPLKGSFAEFGTYRAGYAFMILGLTDIERIYLFDTFKGIPGDRLTDYEQKASFAGRLTETSPEYVEGRLSRWPGRFEICAGDVFDTLPRTETGPLAFISMDLNAAAPTTFALEYAYPRLVPGGTLVFDDYGARGFHDQRTVIDEFFSDKPDQVIALPTCQGIVVKKP